MRRLFELEEDADEGLSIRYRRRLLDRTVRVIVEQAADEPGIKTGRCDHYARIRIRTDRPRGAVVRARVTGVEPARTIGEIVSSDVSLPVCR